MGSPSRSAVLNHVLGIDRAGHCPLRAPGPWRGGNDAVLRPRFSHSRAYRQRAGRLWRCRRCVADSLGAVRHRNCLSDPAHSGWTSHADSLSPSGEFDDDIRTFSSRAVGKPSCGHELRARLSSYRRDFQGGVCCRYRPGGHRRGRCVGAGQGDRKLADHRFSWPRGCSAIPGKRLPKNSTTVHAIPCRRAPIQVDASSADSASTRRPRYSASRQ
jgi:hypothetical protein